jgi:(E)-4-hydroxy-3-methylbut-2-enyl-diphosphate synthase
MRLRIAQGGRLPTREVRVGNIGIGGKNPVRIQSMITCDTMDTDECVRQTIALAEAGCEIVRITAPTVKHAANLREIKEALRRKGCDVPIVADIHFKPEAALEAAKWVEKVRINPGNYADKKKFVVREYTDAEYEAELDRVRAAFTPLVCLCKERGVAMRIGTNHGSLSDRIMNRYGDTPLGMVESALEFARIARDLDYHDFVFSMKASNPKVMIAAYRLLVARLQEEGADWNYPIHLGVTEAGDGEDGRIKSAIGIGALLLDGIGDTVRVSLTEDSIHEIPVARRLVELTGAIPPAANSSEGYLELDAGVPTRRPTQRVEIEGISVGGGEVPRVFATPNVWQAVANKLEQLGQYRPELVYGITPVVELDPRDDSAIARINASLQPQLVTVADSVALPVVPAFRILAERVHSRHPILLKDTFWPSKENSPFLDNLLTASANLGALLCDGIGDAVLVRCEPAPEKSLRIAYNILQAAGARIFKTDYVACPSCGRTLFDLQSTTARVKQATSHLKGVRIAVMGCIVNGPGEMADADFGYVGGAPGKINLYVGKTPVRFNIPEAEAVERLVDLIREHGKWVEPPPQPENS